MGDPWRPELQVIATNAGVPFESKLPSEVRREFSVFANTTLAEETSVRAISLKDFPSKPKDVILKEAHIITPAILQPEPRSYNCWFVNRHLLKSNDAGENSSPANAAKLRISELALRTLLSTIEAPPAFLHALSRYFLPFGRGSVSTSSSDTGARGGRMWHLIPVRMQVKCSGSSTCYATQKSHQDQMNPFHQLHLPHAGVDIRGFVIALAFAYTKDDQGKMICKSLAVNFGDGRWPKAVQEPENAVKAVLVDQNGDKYREDPFFIQATYLSCAVRWWTNALSSIHDQLIIFEVKLQSEAESKSTEEFSSFFEGINRSLHSMAAHLHRHSSELKSLEATTMSIIAQHVISRHDSFSGKTYLDESGVAPSLREALSQVRAIIDFEAELEKKIQNNLALLFNRIQLSNDRVMVANGKAMQAIMEASREVTKVSRILATKAHKLSESMKKDSLSMRTIAACTMLFLPGTSFAAILSMPFFDNDLKRVGRLWLWIVLTVPSTIFAFAFYFWRQMRDGRVEEGKGKDLDMEEGVGSTGSK